jgi:putative transposase
MRNFLKSKIGQTFWSDGYFVCSIGNVSKEVIEKYIQEQG